MVTAGMTSYTQTLELDPVGLCFLATIKHLQKKGNPGADISHDTSQL